MQLLDVAHVLQEREDIADLLDERRRQAGGVVALDEPPQALVDHVPNLHGYEFGWIGS